MSHPVADYLHELYLISGVSVPETSGYPALSKLLNAVGDSLKLKISALVNQSNNGVGILGHSFALWSWRGKQRQTG